MRLLLSIFNAIKTLSITIFMKKLYEFAEIANIYQECRYG